MQQNLGSKAFMKRLCAKHSIPTAKFKVCKNIKHINDSLQYFKLPLVVKSDGLAAGKGVTICKTKKQVLNISTEIFKGKFKSSKKIVLEEFLKGEEASFFLIVDKNYFKFLDQLKITNKSMKMIKVLTQVVWEHTRRRQ